MPNPATYITPGDLSIPTTPATPIVVPYGRGLQISVIGYTYVDDFFKFRFHKNGAFWRDSAQPSQIDYDVSYGVSVSYTVAAMDTSLPPNISPFSAAGSGTPSPWKTPDYDDGSVTGPKVGTGAITTVKLDDFAVTTIKIGDTSVSTAKLGDGSVITVKMADGSVTTLKIQTNAITSGGQASSTASLTYTGPGAGGGNVDLPGMALTLTTVGGVCQVFVSVVLNERNLAAAFAQIGGLVLVQRNAVTVHTGAFASFNTTASGSVGDQNWTTLAFSFLDAPPPGVHTWKVLWGISLGTMAMEARDRALTVIEFRR